VARSTPQCARYFRNGFAGADTLDDFPPLAGCVLLAQPSKATTPFDLQATITAALSTGQALTFDRIVAHVAESLKPDIRLTLNELVAEGQIRRRVGGRNYPWRYQATR
jgi:hypothetical protein